jgi:hypothetical protein
VVEPEIVGPQYLQEIDRGSTIEETGKNLRKMKNNCPGWDEILVEMWKNFRNIRNGNLDVYIYIYIYTSRFYIYYIYNKIRGGKAYPKEWKIAIVGAV